MEKIMVTLSIILWVVICVGCAQRPPEPSPIARQSPSSTIDSDLLQAVDDAVAAFHSNHMPVPYVKSWTGKVILTPGIIGLLSNQNVNAALDRLLTSGTLSDDENIIAGTISMFVPGKAQCVAVKPIANGLVEAEFHSTSMH